VPNNSTTFKESKFKTLWLSGQSKIYDDLSVLIEKANQDNEVSLATFKPTRILDFIVEEVDREWNPEK
jgi:hypothetical protein